MERFVACPPDVPTAGGLEPSDNRQSTDPPPPLEPVEYDEYDRQCDGWERDWERAKARDHDLLQWDIATERARLAKIDAAHGWGSRGRAASAAYARVRIEQRRHRRLTRSRRPMLRCARARPRDRRSHHIARVAKTAGGDSGDGDLPAEPPDRRTASSLGGAL